MADPTTLDRDVLERRLALQLVKTGRSQMESVVDRVSGGGEVSVPWVELEQELARDISDELEAAFMAAAMAILSMYPGAVDDIIRVQMLATAWASSHAAVLASDLHKNTSAALDQLVSRARREGWDGDRLTLRILALMGAARAELVSITEVTRAITEGEKAVILLIAALGIMLKPFHFTMADERVCPVCAPRHGQHITDGRFSPLHPRCRCRTEWRVQGKQ